MRANAVHGLNYHFFPGDLSNKLDSTIIESGLNKVMSGSNQIHLFVGEMPAEEELYAFDSIDSIIDSTNGYGAQLAASIGVMEGDSFEINYTYDRARKERVIKKWPVNAKNYEIQTGGAITWAAIRIEGVTPTEGKDQIIFTDAIGSWKDNETIILLDKIVVAAGDQVEFKDFTFASRDVLPGDIVDGEMPAEIIFDETVTVLGSTTVKATINNMVDGDEVTVVVVLAGESNISNGTSYTIAIVDGGISLDISAEFADGLASGDKVISTIAGTYSVLDIA